MPIIEEEPTLEEEQPPTRELSEEEVEALIESQREVSEHVGDLNEVAERVRVTEGARIDDLKSFQVSGASARKRQLELVEAATAAVEFYDANGHHLTKDHADAITEEGMAALSSDLWPSQHSEAFFGCTPPDFYTEFTESGGVGHCQGEVAGLICYRAWQLLLKQPKGRELLLSAFGREYDPKQNMSYDAIKEVLSMAILSGTQIDLLENCVLAMKDVEGVKNALSSYERTILLQSIKEYTLDWRVVVGVASQ